MTIGAAQLSDHSFDTTEPDLIEARIEGAKIVDGKIVDGRIVRARRVGTVRTHDRRASDRGRYHAEIVGVIGLLLVLLTVFLLRA